MSPVGPLAKTEVGVVMERRKAKSQWIDFVWRPVSVLPGVPDTPPWTQLESRDEITLFYAGSAEIGLYRSDTPQYRDNLATGTPGLWIVARPTGGEPPFAIVTVTANPRVTPEASPTRSGKYSWPSVTITLEDMKKLRPSGTKSAIAAPGGSTLGSASISAPAKRSENAITLFRP